MNVVHNPVRIVEDHISSYAAISVTRGVSVVVELLQSADWWTPWWEHLAIIRTACNSGQPLPSAFLTDYVELFAKLDRLEADEDWGVCPAAVEGARELLNHSLFAGFAAPRVSWHGRSAVVLYWAVGSRVAFFTVDDEGKLSILQEDDRKFVRREDSIDREHWGRFFPQ
jgi:hypothetical protein